MARTKEFEPDQAIESALKVFWRDGYERTSVSDLLTAMGIRRGSMYDTFGDKRSLFVECLSRYAETYLAQLVWVLSQDLPVRGTLESLFRRVTDLVHEDGRNWGCLMVNTASELSLHDARVAEIVTANFEALERSFAGFLERGRRTGEVPAGTDVRAKARFLTSSFVGIATLAKTGVPSEFLEDSVRSALSFLD